MSTIKTSSSMPATKHADRLLFPQILHNLLQTASKKGWEDVVSWNEPHGKSFKIHNRTEFLKLLANNYGLRPTKYKSFVRQLNLWGFACIHGGKKNVERGSYYHTLFCRDDPSLMNGMRRIRVKGKTTRRRRPSKPQEKQVMLPCSDTKEDHEPTHNEKDNDDDDCNTVMDPEFLEYLDQQTENFITSPQEFDPETIAWLRQGLELSDTVGYSSKSIAEV